MELKPHQYEAVRKAFPILFDKNLVYIFGQPRVGKSLISLELAQPYGKALVLTKKGAIKDWEKYRDYDYDVINYEKAKNIDPSLYKIFIIDEAHNFSALPKPSQRTTIIKYIARDKPLILLSGTPLVETPLAVYPQFSLSSYSPFRHYPNFYEFFYDYGIPSKQWIAGRMVETYSQAKLYEIEKTISPYIVPVTYKDAGFEYNNTDEVVSIKNINYTSLYNTIKKDKFINNIPLENTPALIQCLHQVEGGFYKGMRLDVSPKLEWLINYTSSLTGRTAIMAYFTEEQEQLSKIFKDNKDIVVLSSTKYCEGVDLSDYNTFILYSFGYSGSKFIQLRDRVVNLNKHTHTHPIIPLIEGGFCEQVYKAVSNKRNFNLRMFGESCDNK